MSDIVEAESHTLTYQGLVDPPIGTLMGPSLDDRFWKVVGSVYNSGTKTTAVTVEDADERVGP